MANYPDFFFNTVFIKMQEKTKIVHPLEFRSKSMDPFNDFGDKSELPTRYSTFANPS
jgi:hypothetical protein